MQVLYRRTRPVAPRLSIVLLDWNCRESLHMLSYLADQTADRGTYEILWVEFYARQLPELRAAINRDASAVDTWVVIEAGTDVYYHKHLMYNAALLLARGDIICFCDSDTMVTPQFVESVLQEFDRDPVIVFHHDEVRNHSSSLYPFRHPTFADVRGYGCGLMIDRRTLGIWDERDPLHTRNYGACMSARRDDLIAIGGADMHDDYLGYICGPYEMTFRLRNMGRREVWHTTEYLYHTWHPGQAGDNNFAGPHDGRNMSTTALEALESGRTRPLVEHPLIATLRERRAASPDFEFDLDEITSQTLLPSYQSDWQISLDDLAERVSTNTHWTATTLERRSKQIGRAGETNSPKAFTSKNPQPPPFYKSFGVFDVLAVVPELGRTFLKEVAIKQSVGRQLHRNVGEAVPQVENPHEPRSPLRRMKKKVQGFFAFAKRFKDYYRHLIRLCWYHLNYVTERGATEIVVFGTGEMARFLKVLAGRVSLKVVGICPTDPDDDVSWFRSRGISIWTDADLATWPGPIVVGEELQVDQLATRLEQLGIPRERYILLQ